MSLTNGSRDVCQILHILNIFLETAAYSQPGVLALGMSSVESILAISEMPSQQVYWQSN